MASPSKQRWNHRDTEAQRRQASEFLACLLCASVSLWFNLRLHRLGDLEALAVLVPQHVVGLLVVAGESFLLWVDRQLRADMTGDLVGVHAVVLQVAYHPAERLKGVLVVG